MLRIKLFGLFVAFAVVALVRPREVEKLLDAAEDGVRARRALKQQFMTEMRRALRAKARAKGHVPPHPIPAPRGPL